MGTFTGIPKMSAAFWVTQDSYNPGHQELTEFEIEAEVLGIDFIKIGPPNNDALQPDQHVMLDYNQAHELFMDLISARLAEVTQKQKRSHPFAIETHATLVLRSHEDFVEVDPGTYEQLMAWLRYALGIEAYTGDPDKWEY